MSFALGLDIRFDNRELHKEIFGKLSKYCRNEYSCTRYLLSVDSYFVEYLKWRIYSTINVITLIIWIPLIRKQVKQWYLRSFVETVHDIQTSSLCNAALNRGVVFYFSTYKISMCYLNIGLKCKQNNFNNHFIFIMPKGRLFLRSPRQVIEWLKWYIISWFLALYLLHTQKKHLQKQNKINHQWALQSEISQCILCFTSLSYMDLTILIKM